MKQKYYEQCDLMLLKDERNSRLYRVEHEPDGTMKLLKMKFLSEPHAFIEVYPQCNLIISSRSIYSLNEEVVISRIEADVKLYPAGNNWVIVLDYNRDNNTRYCVVWWNGKKKYVFAFGSKLIVSERYFALYTKRDKCWSVYTAAGSLVLELKCPESQDIEIKGDFIFVHSVGDHAIYSLKQMHKYTLGESIFRHQQLILCSEHDDFVICCGLSGMIQTFYHGSIMQFERAEQIDILDFTSLFCLKRGKKFYLYRFNGEPFATDICPNGADMVATDKNDKSVLIGVGENYHLLKKF